MSLVLTLKDIAETQLTRKVSFIYASLDYANVIADKFDTYNFPIIIMLPLDVTDSDSASGVLDSEVDISLFILDRHQDATIEYDHLQTETEIIEPMRAIGRQFFHKLMENEIADQERELPARTYVPTYSALDRHTAGVFVQVKVPVSEGITGC